MFSFLQVFLCLVSLYHVSGKPFFGEIKFKKNFEIEHKPIPFPPFKPIEFIKEIVTPFGRYGVKHGIGKRDLDSIKSIEDSEPERVPFWDSRSDDRYEVEEPLGPSPMPPLRNVPLSLGPVGPGLRPLGPIEPGKEQVVEITPKPVPHHEVPEPKPEIPQIPGLRPEIPQIPGLKPEPPHVPDIKPEPPLVPDIKPILPVIPEPKPIPAPPRPPVVITPPPPKIERPPAPKEEVLPLPTQGIIPRPPPRGFNTDIAREQAINEYLKIVGPVGPVENSIAPEKPKEEAPVEPPPPPNPIVRGSRLAWYVGNIFLDIISQFLGGTRVGNILDRPITI